MSVTCGGSVVFSEYFGFLHQYNWPPRYNWNIIESGVKLYNTNPYNYLELMNPTFLFTSIYRWYPHTNLYALNGVGNMLIKAFPITFWGLPANKSCKPLVIFTILKYVEKMCHHPNLENFCMEEYSFKLFN